MLVVVTTTAGTGTAFVVPPPSCAEFGQCDVVKSMHHSDLRAGGVSRRIRWAKFPSALFAKPKPSDEEMEKRKEQLRELLGATEAEIDKLVLDSPNVFIRRDIVGNHGPKVALLQKRLGVSQKDVGRLFLRANRLLNVSLETLVLKIDWLQARLDLSKSDLRKIIKREPVTLAYSIKDNLEPSLGNIQNSLALSDKELTKMIVSTPELLSRDMSTKKLAARLSFLYDKLNIEEGDIEKLRKAIIKRPPILYWPEKSMLESQQWIKD